MRRDDALGIAAGDLRARSAEDETVTAQRQCPWFGETVCMYARAVIGLAVLAAVVPVAVLVGLSRQALESALDYLMSWSPGGE